MFLKLRFSMIKCILLGFILSVFSLLSLGLSQQSHEILSQPIFINTEDALSLEEACFVGLEGILERGEMLMPFDTYKDFYTSSINYTASEMSFTGIREEGEPPGTWVVGSYGPQTGIRTTNIGLAHQYYVSFDYRYPNVFEACVYSRYLSLHDSIDISTVTLEKLQNFGLDKDYKNNTLKVNDLEFDANMLHFRYFKDNEDEKDMFSWDLIYLIPKESETFGIKNRQSANETTKKFYQDEYNEDTLDINYGFIIALSITIILIITLFLVFGRKS